MTAGSSVTVPALGQFNTAAAGVLFVEAAAASGGGQGCSQHWTSGSCSRGKQDATFDCAQQSALHV